MNVRAILHAVSFMVMVIGVAIGISLGMGWLYGDPPSALHGMAVSAFLCLAAGFILSKLSLSDDELSPREGILVVTAGWFIACVFGALPYILTGSIHSPVAAIFESVSGFTTTGASVVADVEALPKGILFWRALTHFLGGMGVLVLCVAILPLLGTGGMQIFRAEMTGPTKERLTPRIASTAKLLWGVYVLLCVLETLFLKFGGMTWFDALCHSFATLATGGFSTRNASIAAYHSLYIEGVVVVFMILGATNMVLYYRLLMGNPWLLFRDGEWRFYLGLWMCAILLVAANIWKTVYPSFLEALHHSLFTVTSILSTTGLVTVDFDKWPAQSKLILLVLMAVGGCTGSTAGGIKALRVWVTIKSIVREMKLFMQQNAVIPLRVGRQIIQETIAAKMIAYIVLYLFTMVFASLIMTFYTPDLQTAFSSVLATMGGVGPGLGAVGPTQVYMSIPDTGKIVLILCMLLGRLEFYTLLVLLMPVFWKK
ncbi:MAG: TrkH family potassium uptake protein [Lentisphaerota bacterium]